MIIQLPCLVEETAKERDWKLESAFLDTVQVSTGIS